MRIRNAKIEELKPKARERALSPRQLAALQREDEIKKALGRLKSDDDIIAIEQRRGFPAAFEYRGRRLVAAHDVNRCSHRKTSL